MHLNVFLQNSGNHDSSWRRRGSRPMSCLDPREPARQAVEAEDLGFTGIFIADTPKMPQDPMRRPSGSVDPVVSATLAIDATESLEVIVTISTSYTEPFNTARTLQSLNHLSGGRIGWNIVTTHGDSAARNFGLEAALPHAVRYRRAHEHVRTCLELWDSWGAGAVVPDPVSGVWISPDRLRQTGFRGEHVWSAGPLTLPSWPVGRPQLYQAGQSGDGMHLARSFADSVFVAEETLEGVRAYRSELARLESDRSLPKIICGLAPVLAESDGAAQARFEKLSESVDMQGLIAQFERRLGLRHGEVLGSDSMSRHINEESLQMEGNRTWARNCLAAARGGARVHEFLREFAFGRGAKVVVAGPESMAEWIGDFAASAKCDGFNLMFPWMPEDMADFARTVRPLLADAGA